MKNLILYGVIMSLIVCFISCNHVPDENVADFTHLADTTVGETVDTTTLDNAKSEYITFRKGDVIEVSMLVNDEILTPYTKIVGGYHVQDSFGSWGENDSLMFGPRYIFQDIVQNYDALLPVISYGERITLTLFNEDYEITSCELFDAEGNSLGYYAIDKVPQLSPGIYYTYQTFWKKGQEIDGMRETYLFAVFYKITIK